MSKKKKNIAAKVVASLALFGIVIWILWTALLVIFGWGYSTETPVQLTEEQLQELYKQLEAYSGSLSASGATATWETIK